MLPVCSDHASMLRALAVNTNDKLCQKAYADWLMERGSAGWIIVLNYKIHDWLLYDMEQVEDGQWGRNFKSYCRLPWIEGRLPYKQISHHLTRIKWALNQFADGKAV